MKLDNSKKYGIIGTLAIHGIVLAILLLFSFSAPTVEYPEPDGIVVDFGELVMGDSDGATETTVAEPTQTATVQNNEPSVVTQNDVPSIPVKTNPTKVDEATPELTPEEKERIRQEEEFKKRMDALAGKMNQGGGNGGEGNGGNSETGAESGKAGNPNGSGNSGNTKGNPGNPLGNGDAVHLAKPNSTTNCNNPITLTVKVDASGKVVAIQSFTNGYLEQMCIDAAKEAAMKTTFPPDSKSIRYAKITYEYTVSHK
jgi:hypothetical protein